jgi:site-specific DNA-methyltransferase (adenine-specific)
MKHKLHHGDCREVMAQMPDNSVDAIVTDPPYGLSFMGKGWDHGVPGEEFWAEALRVAKPGAHLLAFGGTRTFHRLACAIEDAGWEIRDTVGWIYGSGFPKSHNLKDQWAGYGTALKPAWEPVIVARKPLVGTVAANVLEYGTGAINVDGCRVACTDKAKFPAGIVSTTEAVFGNGVGRYANRERTEDNNTSGRWPANIIHDGSDEVLALFPVTKSHGGGKASYGGVFGNGKTVTDNTAMQRFAGDTGSAARFFYTAKASKRDRDEGCEGLPPRQKVFNGQSDSPAGKALGSVEDKFSTQPARNFHPTVKPTDLMRYLCRLVTPPDGVVLDPFMGSGSTGKAALLEGFRFIGIEREAEYLEIARARIEAVNLGFFG